MGAHLGHGGLVEGELLRCTFHGFCFDGRGACARTPYGTLPSATVRLVQWEVRERHGLVLAWYDAARRPPLWEIPDLDSSGWLAAATGRLEVDSHPQETTENSVDLGHFTALHSFESSRVTREMTTEGPRLEISYQAVRELASVGRRRVEIVVDFDVTAWGLGYSLVEQRIETVGLRARHWVLATPVSGDRIELRLASAVRRGRAWPLTAPVDLLVRSIVFRGLRQEVALDVPIWNRKMYRDPPGLAKGDGPVGRYRQWARQFYPLAPHERGSS
jgi:hypothetical protein